MGIFYGWLLVTSFLAGCRAISDSPCNISFVDNVEAYCQDHPFAKLPHPDDCSAYFDCSFTFEDIIPRFFSQHMVVCEYPLLYEAITQICQPFESVNCCDRLESKSPCDYRNFKCPFAHCQPCEFNRPSCKGLEDGVYPVTNRHNLFFSCSKERTMRASVQSCPQNRQFDAFAGGCGLIAG